jgi:glycosyltransferase involved in cell wall biosynthesis
VEAIAMSDETGTRKLISIVTPCYNEELNVAECYRTVRRIVEEQLPAYDYEHVFCDNASTDRTLAILREIAGQDRHVRVIVNSRNFGPFHSNFNGILATRGQGVLLFLPADLQDPPELLPELVKRWEEGYEVVYGVRKQREESASMRAARAIYYRLAYQLADIHLEPGVGEFQFVDRVVVESLTKFDDYYPYIRGMVAYCGFRATGIEYTWKRRERGFSKNSLLRLVDQALNGMLSFSKAPMRLCMGLGMAISAASLLYAAVGLVWNIIYYRQVAPPGVATLIVGLFLFSGIQLFFFGVLGEYIAAIHMQVRRRPLVLERERINFIDPPRSLSGAPRS